MLIDSKRNAFYSGMHREHSKSLSVERIDPPPISTLHAHEFCYIAWIGRLSSAVLGEVVDSAAGDASDLALLGESLGRGYYQFLLAVLRY